MLVNPVNPVRTGLTVRAQFPPLGLGIVAALTPSRYELVLVDENVAPFSHVDADLVGITAFTSSVARGYEIARQYRARGVPVVLGGIHGSMLPDEARRFVDSVVIGEAEEVWGKVVEDFEHGALKDTYQGERGSLTGTVVPRRDLFSPRYQLSTVQTSRGCPMDCSFCSVSAFNGKRYRQRPVEEVLAEIEGIPDRTLFFVDDNILGYGKESEKRAIALFRGMAERRLGKSWFCQASLNFGSSDEVLHWAARSGCKMVFLGLESSDPEELAGMHKPLNLRLQYRQAFERIRRHGIAVLGAFIFGSDAETLDGMERKMRDMNGEGIDVPQATILTPLPGTRVFAQYLAEDRLKYRGGPDAWEHYDMTELTYRPTRMSEAVFEEAYARIIRRTYSRTRLLARFLRTWRATRSLTTALWAYNSNLVYRSVSLATASRK